MKVLLLLLSLNCLHATPRLSSSNRPINPQSTIEIVFDKPMVAEDRLGKEQANDLLNIKPAWNTKILWRAQNIARLVPQEAPTVGVSYKISTASELTARDGTKVEKTTFDDLVTEGLSVQRARKRGTLRSGGYVLFFNDDIDPLAAAPFFHFVRPETKEQGALIVAARTRQAQWGDFGSSYYYTQSWQERFLKKDRPKVQPSHTVIPHAIVVEPMTPLPVGSSWSLKRIQGVPNKTKTASLNEENAYNVGNIVPFVATSVSTVSIPDADRQVRIYFNQKLPSHLNPEHCLQFITFEPAVANLKATTDYRKQKLYLHGDFKKQDVYTIHINQSLTSSEGLPLQTAVKKNLKFTRVTPGLSLPSHDEAQLASGTRTYEMTSTNNKSLHLRIKKLTPEELVRVSQGYRRYTGDGPNNDRIRNRNDLPFELITGTTVFDEVIPVNAPLDTTHTHQIKWDQFLPADQKTGAFFLSVTGDPADHPDLAKSSQKVAQALVQLTDIGLAWKLTGHSAFLYAYSCQTGKALPGVRLSLFGEDARPLHQGAVGVNGLATLPRKPEHRHLRATNGNDTLILPYDGDLPTVSMWRFPVNYAWRDLPEKQRKTLLFTDRQLYRPGETMRLKGLVRILQDDKLTQPTKLSPTLVLTDPAGREVHNAEIKLSPVGSFDFTYKLPNTTVGRYSATLSWPEELEAARGMENWWAGNQAKQSARFVHAFQVQEFKRNTFELTSDLQETEIREIAFELEAKYFQGTAVAEGKVDWYLSASPAGFYPAKYRDFYFGDHRRYDSYYWSHYFGYNDDSSSSRSGSHDEDGEARLDEDGKLSLNFKLPEIKFPSPRRVTVTTEVTDANSQTLTSRDTLTVQSSDFYLGLSRQDQLARVNKVVPFELVTVTPKGEPFTANTPVQVTITREFNKQTKSKAANGRIVVKNETEILPVSQTDHLVTGGKLNIPFTPKDAGRHFFSIRAQDASGRAVQTIATHHVYGTNEYPWAYESGMRIKLVPEQQRYQAGDTARILVLSPIEGEALITIERKGVIRHFQTVLKADNPVIEIPITEEDAPNTFVSVLIIKGATDSKRKHPEPQLRLGYCELTIDPTKDRLKVDLATAEPETRPGETILVSGKVTDHQGRPVTNAEVTFYAEDEGTLAVMGYENPNPIPYFHAPRPLRTENGTSLVNFIPEAPGERFHANKGFIVGGGDSVAGMKAPMFDDLRRNFDPCAAWFPTITTAPDGSFEAKFPAPDTLTRYRLIAVAHSDSSRFGVGTGEAIVNKPLMLEPSPPLFAHQGDRIKPKALLQNTTDMAGTWQVTLHLDSLTGSGAVNSENQQEKLIAAVHLPANGQGSVEFDVHFHNTGTTKWIWHAEPVSLDQSELNAGLKREFSDSVESSFEVRYPMPLLREMQFVTFNDPNKRTNLLKDFSRNLLDGKGHLDLEFSRSRLLEAGGAIDYLLRYPYGCLEQTTSSTIPWVAAKKLRPVAPKFQARSMASIEKNIQAGADRLLSMQTADGGLSYWPGSLQPNPWASSYGGLGILLCQEAGAQVPSSSLDRLAVYLSNQLRNLSKAKTSYDLDVHARALYVLARLGKAEPAYQAKLLEQIDKLSGTARAFLALAVHESGQQGALAILNAPQPEPEKTGYWMRYGTSDAARLLAWSHISPKADECEITLSKLLRTRSSRGHWRTTWCNSWTLLAMGAYAEENEMNPTDIVLTMETADGEQQITIPRDQASHSVRFDLHNGLKLFASSSSRLYLHSTLAAKPKITPVQPISKNGVSLTRGYERVLSNGTTEPLGQPKVGDLVKVTLTAALPDRSLRYLAIDDPLPSSFRAINTLFDSQTSGRTKEQSSWRISNTEVRTDRVLFFVDYTQASQNFEMSYHARVTHEGEVYAPPTKVEEMYDPENYALSASKILTVR